MTATATVIDEREATTAESNGKAKRQRIGLAEDNKYVFAATELDAAKAGVALIYNADKTDVVANFRPYNLSNNKGEVVAVVIARNDGEAKARYLDAKGYTTELADPKERGRSAAPKIDVNTVNLLKQMWAMPGGQPNVLEFLKANKQYIIHFELNKAQTDEVMATSVVEE